MKIQTRYRRNLNMSAGKLSAQVAHCVRMLDDYDPDCKIIVLSVSDKQFFELSERIQDCHVQKDLGYTEVEAGTPTVIGWIEE